MDALIIMTLLLFFRQVLVMWPGILGIAGAVLGITGADFKFEDILNESKCYKFNEFQ